MMDLPTLQRQLGLNQPQFAHVLGVSVASLKNYIRGDDLPFVGNAIKDAAETLTRLLKCAMVVKRGDD